MVFKAKHLQRVLRLRQKSEAAAEAFPALLAQAEKAVSSVLHGEHAQRKSGGGEKFWQFREYTQFDRPQDIDWRQSAKTQRTYIRQKERQTTQKMLLWASNEPSMHFTSDTNTQTKHQSASVLALSLALLFSKGGEQVGLLGQSRPGSSEVTLEKIAHDLSDPASYTPATKDLKNMHIPRNAGLVLISDFLSPIEELHETFKTLSAISDEGHIIQILDRAELTLPYQGRYIFTNPSEKSEKIHIQNVGSMRGEYIKRLEEHNQALKDLCRQYNWNFITHVTDTPPETTLLDLWAYINMNRKDAKQVRA